jgi:hypothetical protein
MTNLGADNVNSSVNEPLDTWTLQRVFGGLSPDEVSFNLASKFSSELREQRIAKAQREFNNWSMTRVVCGPCDRANAAINTRIRINATGHNCVDGEADVPDLEQSKLFGGYEKST